MLKRLPETLLEFQRMFPNEKACVGYLWQVRWPKGFVCPACGGFSAREESKRPLLQGCRACGKQTSITAGTVMHATKLPLRYWFWGAYLMASHSNGMSALQLQKQLRLGSYKTAWLMLNKLRRAMVNPDREKLSGMIEVDEAYLKIRAKDDPDVNKQGRSPVGKIALAVAVEVVEFTNKKNDLVTRPGRIRIEPIPDTSQKSIHGFIRRNIEAGSALVSDSSLSYRGLTEYYVKQIPKEVPHDEKLIWVHRVISLMKTLGLGTYHGYRRRYIRRYCDEFVWRFNRRRSRPATFHLILGMAASAKPAPLRRVILVDPMDKRSKIKAPPSPPPGVLPTGFLETRKAQAYYARGFWPPEDHVDDD
jgi:hypothetical protein